MFQNHLATAAFLDVRCDLALLWQRLGAFIGGLCLFFSFEFGPESLPKVSCQVIFSYCEVISSGYR
jgi:hypothetical protein